MKKILIFIFLIGMFVVACSSPPDTVKPKVTKSEYVQASDLMVVNAPVLNAADETALPVPESPAKGIGDFIKTNWAVLIFPFLAFIKVIVNLTPTEKDNKVFGMLDTLINWLVPNYKSGGGKFT